VRFIVTAEGENLTALANRLFCLEGKEEVTSARRRLLELNPDLPDRKNIPAGTVVFVPADLDGEPAREGRSFADVTEEALRGLQAVIGRLDEALALQIREESARHAREQKVLAEPQLRRAARESPELAARVTRVGEAIAARQQRTKGLQQLAKAATREIHEDLADLARLTGGVLPE
jgi:hypothetical protein